MIFLWSLLYQVSWVQSAPVDSFNRKGAFLQSFNRGDQFLYRFTFIMQPLSKYCIIRIVFVWRPTLLLHIAVVKYNPQWCTMQPAIQSETQLHSCTQVSRQEVQQTTICSHTFQSYQHHDVDNWYQSTIAFQPVNILYHIVICVCDLLIHLFFVYM